jgi:uncharacterized membrane protein
MQRLRNVLADVLVGLVVILVAFWLLRGVFAMVIWAATIVLIVILVVFVLRIAGKLRG